LSTLSETERPEKVVFAVLTDGQENSSKEFSEQHIREMIKEQEEIYKWEIVFLSSDIQCEHDARSIGIAGIKTLKFGKSGVQTQWAFAALTDSVSQFRTGQTTNMSFSSEQKRKADK
jgi:hypothetical protein